MVTGLQVNLSISCGCYKLLFEVMSSLNKWYGLLVFHENAHRIVKNKMV